jgi:hypothetical protein
MAGSSRRSRRRQKRPTIRAPEPTTAFVPNPETPGKEPPQSRAPDDPWRGNSVARHDLQTQLTEPGPSLRWLLTEQSINNRKHYIYFESHRESWAEVTCSISEADKYHGHPLISLPFLMKQGLAIYDRPGVRSVFENGAWIISRRMVKAVFRDENRFYKMELMVIPKDREIYRINGWIRKDGRIPDIVLNSRWQEGHVHFGGRSKKGP